MAEVYMLCGVAGSGKTTYAETLLAQGIVEARLSIDEGMAVYGQAGEDYPVDQYPELEREVIEDQKMRMLGHIASEESVILDYGFGRREQRDEYKALIEEAGATWRLIFFRASHDTARERVQARNLEPGENTVLSDELHAEMASWFEEPNNEGEEIIEVG